MRRAVAHAVICLACLGMTPSTRAANINSSPKLVGQAKVQKNIKTTVVFRPELSLQENNSRILAHRETSFVISITLPVDRLDSLRLVNRSVDWNCQGQLFSGRITAVSLSADRQQVTLFAEISDQYRAKEHFTGQESGLLRIAG